jgi:hypothetical protein
MIFSKKWVGFKAVQRNVVDNCEVMLIIKVLKILAV